MSAAFTSATQPPTPEHPAPKKRKERWWVHWHAGSWRHRHASALLGKRGSVQGSECALSKALPVFHLSSRSIVLKCFEWSCFKHCSSEAFSHILFPPAAVIKSDALTFFFFFGQIKSVKCFFIRNGKFSYMPFSSIIL